MIYERAKHPLLDRPAFLRRVLNHSFLALLMIASFLHRVLHRFHLDDDQ